MNLSYSKAVKFGFFTYIKNIKYFILLVFIASSLVIPTFFTEIILHVTQLFNQKAFHYGALIGAQIIERLLFLFLLILGVWILIKSIYIGSKAYEHKKILWQDYVQFDLQKLLKIILATVLGALLIMSGLIAFIIPGIYFLITYYFTNYIIIDKNVGVIQSFKQSSKLTSGFKWSLVWKLPLIFLTFAFIALVLNLFLALLQYYITGGSLSFEHFSVAQLLIVMGIIFLNNVINYSCIIMIILATTYLYKKLDTYKFSQKNAISNEEATDY